jgi:hypothetical protein
MCAQILYIHCFYVDLDLHTIQSLMRTYLIKNELLIASRPSHQQPLPEPASQEDIKAYENDGDGGPTLPGIRLDWESSLKSSLWNDAAITLLASDFHSEIKKDKIVKYDDNTMNVHALKKLCAAKLVRTRRAICMDGKLKNLDVGTREITQSSLQDDMMHAQTVSRRRTRKQAVSFGAHLIANG